MAYECDKVPAFGGIVAVNRPLDRSTAEQIVQIVTNVVVARAVLEEAKDVLARRKHMIVLVADSPHGGLFDYDVRSVPGGFLVQDWDRTSFDRSAFQTVTQREPTEEEWEQLGLAWIAVKHVKSNAIVLFKAGAPICVRAGPMCRRAAVAGPVPPGGGEEQGAG